MREERKGMLIVVSGAAGTGKGTICQELLTWDQTIRFSVSVTTRKPRPQEVEGVHYYFITEERYDELLAQDAFVEHATVHGHRYGTLKSEVDSLIGNGFNVLLDIDSQGAKEVIRQRPDCVSIFILPPSYQALRDRLEKRNTEEPDEIERRMHNAYGEIALKHLYQYNVVNDDLDTAVNAVRAIVTAEKLRTTRYFPVVE